MDYKIAIVNAAIIIIVSVILDLAIMYVMIYGGS